MRKIYWWLSQRSWWQLAIFGILVKAILVLTIQLISPDSLRHPGDSYSLMRVLIEFIIIAPWLETAIFQVLPIELGFRLNKASNKLILVSVSALLFSLDHLYSLGYLVYSLIMGLVLASYYVIIKMRTDDVFKSFAFVSFCHLLMNFLSFIILILSNKIT